MNPHLPPVTVAHRRRPAAYPTRVAGTLGLLLCALMLGACTGPAGDEQRQADVVERVYRIHLKADAPGLPTPDELRQLQPLVSDALHGLLAQAQATEARYRAAAGAQAPPLVEGDLMTSLYEGATSFSVQSCETDAQRATCEVAFRYHKDGSDESWSDKVLLVQQDRQWRVDDVEFIGNDQSSHREYLSDNLADVVAHD